MFGTSLPRAMPSLSHSLSFVLSVFSESLLYKLFVRYVLQVPFLFIVYRRIIYRIALIAYLLAFGCRPTQSIRL